MGSLAFIGGYGSGISVYSRDGVHLTRLGSLATPDPSYLIADPRTAGTGTDPAGGGTGAAVAGRAAHVLYAVNELTEGAVTSYAVEPDGGLRVVSTQPTGGVEPCHLALHTTDAGAYLIVANYGSGSASVHPVGSGGALGPGRLVRHHGRGPNPDRQAGPHAHQVHLFGDLVTVVDLGLDRLVHYRLDPTTGGLDPAGETSTVPGSGPRHAVTHPSGRWYVSCELDSTVAAFEPDPDTGALRRAATRPATESIQPGTASAVNTVNQPAGIALSADGRFLYVSNRGADTIATFAVRPDGALELAGETSTGGHWPRQFAIVSDPREGELIYVANQNSGTVVALRVDPDTGVPVPTGAVTEVQNPSCVLLTEWLASGA